MTGEEVGGDSLDGLIVGEVDTNLEGATDGVISMFTVGDCEYEYSFVGGKVDIGAVDQSFCELGIEVG